MSAPPIELMVRFREPDTAVPPGIGSLDDDDIKVASVWPLIPKDWLAPEYDQPADLAMLWEWLWAGVNYDVEALTIGTGLIEDAACGKLESLAMRRLVNPDGTISPWIGRVAGAAMRARFRIPAGRQQRTEE